MLRFVLSWPLRVFAIGLLILSLLTDGAGYIYRITNHLPLTGSVPGLPPHFGDFQVYIHRGLDISGGTRLLLELEDLPPGKKPSEVQAVAIDVINRRINALGVSEPSVRAVGDRRIEVELAGVSASRAQDVIGRTAKLVFTKWVKDDTVKGGPEPGYRPQFIGITGADLTSASASLDPNGLGWVVNLSFNSRGADIYAKVTTEAYNACPTTLCPERHIAAWLDLTQADIDGWATNAATVGRLVDQGGKLLTDPYIQNPILGGSSQISGNFTQRSAQDLAVLFNNGALPATIKVIQSSDVGATLGAQAVAQSLAAGALGLLVVIIFMITYYRVPGALASLALLFYAGLTLALFKLIPVTLTLAGIAGFILSVGMAVDANVLIFERFKEEVRQGRTIPAAVEAGVARAWPAIRDSNTSTLITCLILAVAGQGGPVQGFAITLAIGVLVSLFSSIVVTHNLLAIVLNFGSMRTPRLLGAGRATR